MGNWHQREFTGYAEGWRHKLDMEIAGFEAGMRFVIGDNVWWVFWRRPCAR